MLAVAGGTCQLAGVPVCSIHLLRGIQWAHWAELHRVWHVQPCELGQISLADSLCSNHAAVRMGDRQSGGLKAGKLQGNSAS